MKVLVIGSGGREHAIVKALKKSPKVSQILAAPGNPGIAQEAPCFPIKVEDISALIALAQKEQVDLAIVGPELPLTFGIVDEFQKAGLKIFGPTQQAARLEASKVFTKNFLKKYKIPTAAYEVFSEAESAHQFLRDQASRKWVLKADGLAAGKGVIVPITSDEAHQGVDRILVQKEFGPQQLVIEEFLDGEELSFMVICDGIEGLSLATSQDHKRLFDNDEGPNTGGMGAYSPVPLVTEELSKEIMRTIIAPTLAGMREEGSPFTGILYAGLMICKGKPLVLEYNVRFGDPEAQVILPRLESDWIDLFEAALSKRLSSATPRWKNQSVIVVVLAAEGYPANPKKGDVITGLDEAEQTALVYHAGTSMQAGNFVTAGGRVLGVTALGDTLLQAREVCYQAVNKIKFSGMQFRQDIGKKGMK